MRRVSLEASRVMMRVQVLMHSSTMGWMGESSAIEFCTHAPVSGHAMVSRVSGTCLVRAKHVPKTFDDAVGWLVHNSKQVCFVESLHLYCVAHLGALSPKLQPDLAPRNPHPPTPACA